MDMCLPECKLNLLVCQVDIIVQGEHGLCLDIGEGEEPIV